MSAGEESRVTVFGHGHVQGVGFRWWARSQALELGLAGSATNLDDGRVCVVAQGDTASCVELVGRLQPEYPGRRPGRVRTAVSQWSDPKPGTKGIVER